MSDRPEPVDPRRPAVAPDPNDADRPLRLYDTARGRGRPLRARARSSPCTRAASRRTTPPTSATPRSTSPTTCCSAACATSATRPAACATSPTSTTRSSARPASSACTTSTWPPPRSPASTTTWRPSACSRVVERAPGHLGHRRHPRLHRHGARPGPRLPGRRRRLLRRRRRSTDFGAVSATTTATRCSAFAAERGGNVDDPQQARPARLRALAAVARRRAVLGVAVGPGPPGLAHRVLGAGPARARHHHRPARRRRRPDLPAPRVRGAPSPRPPPASRSCATGCTRRWSAWTARRCRSRSATSCSSVELRKEWDADGHPPRRSSSNHYRTAVGVGRHRHARVPPTGSSAGGPPATATAASTRSAAALDDDLDTPGAVAAIDAAAAAGQGVSRGRRAARRRSSSPSWTTPRSRPRWRGRSAP